MTLCGYFHREKTGDCAYDFRHRHIQLRKKLMLNTKYIHCKTSESVLNKNMDNYSFKYIDNLLFFLRTFDFDILKIRQFGALSKKEDFELTFSTNQSCHLQDGLEIKISVMFMTSLLFSEVFIMVEYFSKTEYVICTFRQISEVPDQTYKHSSAILLRYQRRRKF